MFTCKPGLLSKNTAAWGAMPFPLIYHADMPEGVSCRSLASPLLQAIETYPSARLWYISLAFNGEGYQGLSEATLKVFRFAPPVVGTELVHRLWNGVVGHYALGRLRVCHGRNLLPLLRRWWNSKRWCNRSSLITVQDWSSSGLYDFNNTSVFKSLWFFCHMAFLPRPNSYLKLFLTAL